MTDTLSKEDRSKLMSRIHGRDTRPEMIVRGLIHKLGYRYRLHAKFLPGKPDLVFTARKKVIFVHGCFWHRHTDCKLARLPKSRLGFWLPKLEGNSKRDELNQDKLKSLGWCYLIIWECETKDLVHLENKILCFLNDTD
ncbi:MAG: DNA mismatch endonuclease Vsr [Candidatus Thiodiazotropha sp. (ex Codakia orbicularis)]|nr:DNA mismatch endonuclease Vsr [Candidatus Thiodiazotropha sp. (ex Codakia orbicularis)]